ncbi:MAG: hypothetical protein RR140_02010 [Clostridia bacterium]
MKKYNGLCSTIKKSFMDYKQFGDKLILSGILEGVIVLLAILVPSIAFPIVAYSFLCVGQAGFCLAILSEKKADVKNVFCNYKTFLNAFTAKILVVATAMLCLFLFIIPAIIVLLNYSFVSHIIATNNFTPFQALAESRKMTKGIRLGLLAIWIFGLFSVAVCGALGFGIVAIVSTFSVLTLFWKLFIAIMFSLVPFFTFAFPIFNLMISNAFLQVKNYDIQNSKKKINKNISQPKTSAPLI